MAGHSKFKNIMHRKSAQDKKRAITFSRLGREITVAVKTKGSNPESNIRLRSAIDAAKSFNMPKDNIEKAINKGERNDPNFDYVEVRYEGYGPSGVAIIIDAVTNNKNRTASTIRSILSKYGGSLGETGSVVYNFKRIGAINLEKKFIEEELFEFAITNGALDFETTDYEYTIYCEASDLHNLNEKIFNNFHTTTSTQLIWKSDTRVTVENNNAEKLFKLLNLLEDNEDVQSVSSNFEVSDDIMNQLTA